MPATVAIWSFGSAKEGVREGIRAIITGWLKAFIIQVRPERGRPTGAEFPTAAAEVAVGLQEEIGASGRAEECWG